MNRSAFIVVWSLITLTAFSQGTVYLANRIPGQTISVDAPFFDEQEIRLEGSNYVAQLYAWKPDEGFLAVGRSTPFQTNEYFESIGVTIWFVYPHSPALVQVRAWQVSGGTTFEQAVLAGAWNGVSEPLVLPDPGFGGGFPPSIPAALIGLKYPGLPLIIQQPLSHTADPGSQVTLSVLASSGVGLTYQWYQMPSDRPDGSIPDATNAVHTAGPIETNTTFWVTLSNSAGAVISNPAQVTVVAEPPRLGLGMVSSLPALTLEGVPGTPYRIEQRPALNQSIWTPLVDISLQISPHNLIDSTASNSPARFYRAVAGSK
jgi:hypothetical protein